MITLKLERLEYICKTLPALLKKINETDFAYQQNPGKWSKKQILGHLIDSATNNHQRWIRAQFETNPVISYDQNNWNKFSYYNEIPGIQLIEFWTSYNLQIAELIKRIPHEGLLRSCITGGEPVTLEWLFNDYVDHLEHHLKQITDY